MFFKFVSVFFIVLSSVVYGGVKEDFKTSGHSHPNIDTKDEEGVKEWLNALVDTSYYLFDALPSEEEAEQAVDDLLNWAQELQIDSSFAQGSVLLGKLYEWYMGSVEDPPVYPTEIPVKQEVFRRPKRSSSPSKTPIPTVQAKQSKIKTPEKTKQTTKTPTPSKVLMDENLFKPRYSPQDAPKLEKEIYAMINEKRKLIGLKPLIYNEVIATIARGHSENMAQHIVPSGHQGFHQRTDAIFKKLGREFMGENVAAMSVIQNTLNVMVEGWMNSPLHRENIEESLFVITGIGVVVDPIGIIWVTQMFAN